MTLSVPINRADMELGNQDYNKDFKYYIVKYSPLDVQEGESDEWKCVKFRNGEQVYIRLRPDISKPLYDTCILKNGLMNYTAIKLNLNLIGRHVFSQEPPIPLGPHIYIQAFTYAIVESYTSHPPPKVNSIQSTDNLIYDDEFTGSYFPVNHGHNIMRLICYLGKTEERKVTYLLISNWLVKIKPKNLYAYVFGRMLNKSELGQTDYIEKIIRYQKDKVNYQDMRKHIPSESVFVKFVKDMFLGVYKPSSDLKTEMWLIIRFTASIICESARNFRLIPLVPMALDMFETGDNEIRQKDVDFHFDYHPMARGGAWPDQSRCGFGESIGSSKPHTKYKLMSGLREVVDLESEAFRYWTKSIGSRNQIETLANIAGKFNILPRRRRGKFFEDVGAYLHLIYNLYDFSL